MSLLQRSLGVGYGRAARLIDFMAEDGIVGPYNGSQAREVLMDPDQWAQMQGEEPPGAAENSGRNRIRIATAEEEVEYAEHATEEVEEDAEDLEAAECDLEAAEVEYEEEELTDGEEDEYEEDEEEDEEEYEEDEYEEDEAYEEEAV